jgi:hypothetical protein
MLTQQLEDVVAEKDSLAKELEDVIGFQGKMNLTWVPDHAQQRCLSCEESFHIARRRHHCRYCGRLFCSACLPYEVPLPELGYQGPVKVCTGCAQLLDKDAQ